MCGRFYIAEEDETGEIQRMIEEAERRQKAIIGSASLSKGEMAPGMTAAALALGKSGRVGAFPMEWGFSLQGKRIINTRLETAAEKKMFRESFMNRRCLLPMTHYFEWACQEEILPSLLEEEAWKPKVEKRIRYAIRPEREGVLYLAGLYRYEPEKKLPVFSVLTCAPDESISWLHDRMPVILSGPGACCFLQDPRAAEARERKMVYWPG